MYQILNRWGLRLERDDEIAPEPFLADIGGTPVPVALPGRFALTKGSTCKVQAQSLLAECSIGKGRIVAFADAALLESREDDSQGALGRALRSLLDRLFA